MDIFRQESKETSNEVREAVSQVKTKAQELYDLLEAMQMPMVDKRMLALAKTNLEQSVMWAVKGLTA